MPHESRKARARLLAAAANGEGDPKLVAMVQARIKLIDALVVLGRDYRFAIKSQQRPNRALESYVRRRYTKWTPQASEADRKKYNAEALALIKAATTSVDKHGNTIPGTGDPKLVLYKHLTDLSCKPWDNARDEANDAMVEIARQLHIAPWIESVLGAGMPGLAQILALTGSFDTYANPAKLYSRLGYAPYDGHAGSTWKRESWRPRALTKEEWIAKPFSGERYGITFAIADSMRRWQVQSAEKAGTEEAQPKGPYGEVYLARRKYTAKLHPDWPDQRSHRDAQRIMFKRFLADLWEQWVDLTFEHLGQASADTHYVRAEIAAVGQIALDAQSRGADGGLSSRLKARKRNLGHSVPDAQISRAEIAAVGQGAHDIQGTFVDGGTLSRAKARKQNLGQPPRDAQPDAAETAAVGHTIRDAPQVGADDGFTSRAKAQKQSLGQAPVDAHASSAETAAVGQKAFDIHQRNADGGTSSRAKPRKSTLGQAIVDTSKHNAEPAAVGQTTRDALSDRANSDTSSRAKARKQNLGHATFDAHKFNAETAVVGQPARDAHMRAADGGTKRRGHSCVDAQEVGAATAAASHAVCDALVGHAGSSSKSKSRGQYNRDAQIITAATAAASQKTSDAQGWAAGSGTHSKSRSGSIKSRHKKKRQTDDRYQR